MFNLISTLSRLAVLVGLYLVAKFVYNVYFHPLANFPGPTSWTLTRLPWVMHLTRGDQHIQIKALHDCYGPVVRIAPDELSFIKGSAWADIYAGGNRNKGLPKNNVIFGAQQFRNLLDGTDDEYFRMRKVLAASFSARNTVGQEKFLQRYINKLVKKLYIAAESDHDVNLMEWFTWLAFDITGELVFSESFNQLDQTISHP
ncbi:hypothetical protein MHUMG1_10475 [Metarhizium humberi]|uniref:Cytochrome P450 n=1 Tax=Metarhizium humberi TaxID=2596975 RepID=A0A9P8M0N6_9HYPO|nr:hypothetical protein MHUMG1_10475 [Metarhizium humberi]